jgi:hypothetical protein
MLRRVTVAFIGVIALLAADRLSSQTNDEQLEITATAVNMSNVGTGSTFPIQFTVERWTTPQEREMLVAAMQEKGADGLLTALQKMPSHGRMRVPSWTGPDPLNIRLGWDLRYAWREKNPDGGERIVLGTDRYVSWWEAANRPRTIDYPFTVIEIRTNKDGEGEGKLSVATKINAIKGTNVIELETYASEPVRLQGVRVKVRKT